MRVDELDIPDAVSDALMSAGFRELHPPQAEAIPIALEGRNLVAAIPTASGKSLIGMIPALKLLASNRGKVLYIVPLKALASEKRDDFQRFADPLGFKVHMSTGDLDGEDKGMADADVVIATSEKADSLIRHGSKWMQSVRLVIADEIHMIHDPGRGPTLEITLTKLIRKIPEMQVIALSATISNAYDLADWLDAALVRSDWRPVPLREGVYLDGEIRFEDGSLKEVPKNGDESESLIVQAIDDGGQGLIFVNSRRSTEAVAVRVADRIGKRCKNRLSAAERSILEGEAEATDIGRKLADCVSKGAAFHNAGLTYSQRRMVEDMFKSGRIKCIAATPTLAAGINLPARRVIVRDSSRFENGTNVPLPVMEIKQMCGRAGRPSYDPYGEAVLIAKSQEQADHLMEDYIQHDSETIMSKLFVGNTIRGHMLGILATGDADSEDSIVDFMRDTFFGATSQMFGIESKTEETVDYLVKEEMVRRNGDTIEVLPFGKRVSDLCIDPVSASMLKKAVMKIDDDTPTLQILLAAAMTPDVMGMFPKVADREMLNSYKEQLEGHYLLDPVELDDYMYSLFDSDLKVALVVEGWIEELSEEFLTHSMGIGPGDIRSKVDMMDWIIYSMGEIAYIFNPDAMRKIRPLATRIRYGVKEELIDLVNLRGVGRTRARKLYDAGYRTRSDIAEADVSKLAAMPKIGPSLAASMIRQAGGRHEESARTSPSDEEAAFIDEMAAAYGEEDAGDGSPQSKGEAGPKQASLFDFRSLLPAGYPRRIGQGALVEFGFLYALGPLPAVIGVGFHRAAPELEHHHDVHQTAEDHHQIHHIEQRVRGVEARQEHDHQDHNVQEHDLGPAGASELHVVLPDDVVRHQTGDGEDDQEHRYQVRPDGSDSVVHDVLEGRDGLLADVQDGLVVAVGQDDQCGQGAHDGVDEDPEGLRETLGGRVLDIRHGGDVRDGSDTGLVGQDAPLHTDDEHRTDSSPYSRRHGERVHEDGRYRGRDVGDVDHHNKETDDEPHDGHGRDDSDGKVGHPPDASDDDEQREQGEQNGEEELAPLEGEAVVGRLGHAAHLHRHESDDVHQEHDDGNDQRAALHVQPVEDVVRRSPVETVLVRTDLVDLSDGGLQEARGHSQEREHPHPEDGPRPSDEDRQDGSGYVPDTDAVRHAHAEHVEGGHLALLGQFVAGERDSAHLPQLRELYALQADRAVDPHRDDQEQQHEPDVVDERLEGLEDCHRSVQKLTI